MPAEQGATLHGGWDIPGAGGGACGQQGAQCRVPQGVLGQTTGQIWALGKLSSLTGTLRIVRPIHWSSWSVPMQLRFGSLILVHVGLWWSLGQGGVAGR